MESLCFALLLLLLSCQGPSALQWMNQTQGQARILTCEGSDVTFPWLFTLGPGEQLEDIKWLYTPPGGSSDLIANYLYGHFIPLGAFQNRLRHNGSNGSLELLQVTPQDSGEYVIEVGVHSGSTFSTLRHSVVLEVGVPPSKEQYLAISMTDHAEYDSNTGQLHVQLACGRLSSVGQPPVTVVWTTPSGSEVGSTRSDNGTYFLSVPNPVQGGNYSCRVASSPAGAACVPADVSTLNASMIVDGTAARLMLLEAKGDALMAENNKLKAQLNQTQTTLTNENSKLKQDLNATLNQLTQQNQLLTNELQTTNGSLGSMYGQLRLELRLTESLLNVMKQDVAGLQGQLGQTSAALTGRVNNLDSKLQDYQGKLSKHVSFHAKLSAPLRHDGGDAVLFDQVVTNEGFGYDALTGKFTAPLNGTYFFAFTVTPHVSGQYSNCQLMVDHDIMTRVNTKYENYFNMATGHAVLRLHKGQQVSVSKAVSPISLSFEDDLSFFSGFLVSPDW